MPISLTPSTLRSHSTLMRPAIITPFHLAPLQRLFFCALCSLASSTHSTCPSCSAPISALLPRYRFWICPSPTCIAFNPALPSTITSDNIITFLPPLPRHEQKCYLCATPRGAEEDKWMHSWVMVGGRKNLVVLVKDIRGGGWGLSCSGWREEGEVMVVPEENKDEIDETLMEKEIPWTGLIRAIRRLNMVRSQMEEERVVREHEDGDFGSGYWV